MRNEIITLELSDRLPDLAIPLQTVKDYLIVGHDEDDTIIENITRSAIDLVESKTKRLLSEGTVTFTVKAWCNQLLLPRIPFLTITSFEIRESNAWITFTDYTNMGGYVELYKFGTFKIVYTAGYSDSNPIPQGLQNVVLAQVAYQYENRGDKLRQSGLYTEADKLITQYLNLSWL